MNQKEEKSLSKFISLILRHQPEAVGIQLDEHGWANVEELIEGICSKGHQIDRVMLEMIVKQDEKGRYRFDETGMLIRANQGHSIPVDIELQRTTPPDVLYHGTASRFLVSIREQGLKPMSRLYVHLSATYETACKVGSRHGSPVVLLVDAGRMARDEIPFYLSDNGVWLTKYVDPVYVTEWEKRKE